MDAKSLAEALLRSQAAINMFAMLQVAEPLYSPSTTLINGSTYDFIIIGGGTAGSVMATRLAEEKKHKVLLIEAGDDPTYETYFPSTAPLIRDTPADWNITTENDNFTYQCHVDQKLYTSSGKMLGGTSELNYMMYSRGNVLDYDNWSHLTNDDTWKWVNVLPYFVKLENVTDPQILNSAHKVYHGTEGPLQVTKDQNAVTREYLEAFKEIGHKITLDVDGCELGYSPALINASMGKRQGGASAFLTRVKNNPYLTIAKNSLAIKILFDDQKNAIGVEVINDKDKVVTVYSNNEIILSAGAIKSPQLLMLSGIGPKSHLEEMNIKVIVDSPEVGKNYQDHIAIILLHKTNKPMQPRSCDPGEYPSPLFIGFVALKETSERPDYQAMDFVVTNPVFLLQLCQSAFKFDWKICQEWYNQTKNNEVLVSLISNMYIKSRGEITLHSTDPKVQPKIITGDFSVDEDLEEIVDYVIDYLEVEKSQYFKKIDATMIDVTKCDKFKKGSRKYYRCYCLCMMSSMGHYCGTCAMGTVVDSRLRVKGVQRLRIADASVMPKIVSGNTQPPIMMIAEKLVHFLIQDCEIKLH